MIKTNNFAKIFLLIILVINFFIMMVPIHEIDFSYSDHFFVSWLRSVNLELKELKILDHFRGREILWF
jgi:hypothetical protein